MLLTTGWWSIVPSLMLVPLAVLKESKQTDRIALYIVDDRKPSIKELHVFREMRTGILSEYIFAPRHLHYATKLMHLRSWCFEIFTSKKAISICFCVCNTWAGSHKAVFATRNITSYRCLEQVLRRGVAVWNWVWRERHLFPLRIKQQYLFSKPALNVGNRLRKTLCANAP